MIQLWLAAVAFVGLHIGVSGTRLRDALIRRLGEGAYMGLFSLASVATLVWLVLAFTGARLKPGDLELWGAEPLRHLSLALVFVAYLLFVPGLLTPNPTSVKQEGLLDRPEPARGVVRITRHPFLMGVAIWAFAHILVNGDVASLVLFGALLALGVVGPGSIDAKRRRMFSHRYAAFEAHTSIVPFAAILGRRQRLDLGEIGLWRPALALALYGLTIWLHPYAFHASPLG